MQGFFEEILELKKKQVELESQIKESKDLQLLNLEVNLTIAEMIQTGEESI